MTTLLAHLKEDIQANIDNLRRVANIMHLKLNTNKSKIMRIKANDHRQIEIGEVQMEEVDTFLYLGSSALMMWRLRNKSHI